MSDFQLTQTIKNIKDIQVIFQQSKGKIGDNTTKTNWETLFKNAQKHQIINQNFMASIGMTPK